LANRYLIELLQQEVQEAQQEVIKLRSSLRYRLGDTLLQALPLSWRSFRILPSLWCLVRQRRGRARGSAASSSFLKLPLAAVESGHLLLGAAPAASGGGAEAWITEDAELMALRLRTDAPIASLTLGYLSVSVVRQLARLQQQGCRIIWCPDPGVHHAPELVAYVAALADECRSGETV